MISKKAKSSATLFLLIFTGLFFSSCAPDVPDEPPDWSPDVYGPMVKSVSSIEDITQLENIEFEQVVEATDARANWTGNNVDIDSALVDSVGPYNFPLTEEGYVGEVNVDSMTLRIQFTNKWNLNIKEGTKLVFLSANDNSLIFEHTLQKEVAPNEEFDRTFTVLNSTVASDINFYLVNFQTDGGKDIDFTPPNDKTTFNFQLQFVKIKDAKIRSGKTYSIEDTSEVDIAEAEDSVDVSEDAAEGYLNLYVENGFPIASEISIIFIDQYGNPQYKMVEKREISEADVDPQNGNVNKIIEEKIEIEVNDDVVDDLRDANRVVSRVDLSTVGVPADANNDIKVTRESTLLLQLVADLTINTQELDSND